MRIVRPMLPGGLIVSYYADEFLSDPVDQRSEWAVKRSYGGEREGAFFARSQVDQSFSHFVAARMIFSKLGKISLCKNKQHHYIKVR